MDRPASRDCPLTSNHHESLDRNSVVTSVRSAGGRRERFDRPVVGMGPCHAPKWKSGVVAVGYGVSRQAVDSRSEAISS